MHTQVLANDLAVTPLSVGLVCQFFCELGRVSQVGMCTYALCFVVCGGGGGKGISMHDAIGCSIGHVLTV